MTIEDHTSRASSFLARIDTQLASLADDRARRRFLNRQLVIWQERYQRFVATSGASEPITDPDNPPAASDFLETIVGLTARHSALGIALAQASNTAGWSSPVAREAHNLEVGSSNLPPATIPTNPIPIECAS